MPPLSRIARLQITAILVLGLVVSVVAGIWLVHVNRVVGVGVYTVTAHLPDSGGIFTNAEVTYLGIPVGRVGPLRLTHDGVDVELQLASDAPKVPASAMAVVANRSAIGEQFIDLQPTRGDDDAHLHDGSTITRSSVPPPLDEVVASTVRLAQSIPLDDLHTVITELGKALNGQGDNLSRLVDSLSTLAADGADNLPATIGLIRDANSVLATQADQSDAILAWSHGLDVLTATLSASDPDLRRLLTTGSASATQLSELVQRNGGDAARVVRDLASVTRTIRPATYTTSLTFAMLSNISAGSHSTAPGDGQIHFGVVLETNNPPACTQGYQGTARIIDEMKRANPDFDIRYDDFPFNTSAECTVPQGNPTGVRSAARTVYANPNTPQPWDSTPKKDPDRLDLTPLARQLAALMGVRPV
ncbi:MCE family protein [Gordonia sp. L191]|uniref:MCE family protein n=1 Tax=Gordonia sp. L191 TaxID=2982699 RepID=UPI0024C06A30|nr:MCE family protein [Gordonia sp. L191]WHU45473.1 MCE family protein [Gordonia sp. L191]